MNFAGLPLLTLGILSGIGILLIGFLYLIQLKRQKVQVPYLALWKKVLKQQEERSLWQKFKKLFSYLLQLLLWFLLLLALANPRHKTGASQSRTTVVLIDTSASMSVLEGKKTRLQQAIHRLERWIQKKTTDERVLLVSMNREILPLTSFTSQKKILLQSLQSLSAVDTSADLMGGLGFAQDVLGELPNQQILVFSDAVWTAQAHRFLGEKTAKSLQPLQLPSSLNQKTSHQKSGLWKRKLPSFRLIRVGKEASNVGIIAFNARRRVDNPLQFSTYIEIHNFSKQRVQGTLEISVDDLTVETISFEIQGNVSWKKIFPRLTARGERLKAQIRLQNFQDTFLLDNQAFAVLPKSKLLDVLLLSDENLYLTAALLTSPGIRFEKISCKEKPASNRRYDVLIYNGCSPSTTPKEGNYMFFDPKEKHIPFRLKKNASQRMKSPVITEVMESHPVLKYVVLEDLNIASALWIQKERQNKTLASSFGAPIVVTQETSDMRAILVGFALRQSDFPLRVAFPLFLQNSMQWLMRGDRPLPPTTRSTSKRWKIFVNKGAEVKISGPSTPLQTLQPLQKHVYFSGNRAGFYKLQVDKKERWIAANLSDVHESSLQPPLGWKLPPAPASAKVTLARSLWGLHEYWMLFLVAFLIVFLVEWFTYNRRMTV